jgi:NitT/TauT family transport system substrate-binding protein
MMKRRTLLAGISAVAAPSIAQAQAAPLAIRYGWAITPAQLLPLIFANTGILHHYGRSYTAEGYYFKGSAPQITALAAGELDFAALAFSSFGLAIQNAHLADLRVVADLYQDGVPGYYSSQYVVRADSAIRTIEDLKGKTIASNGLGGAIDMAMRKMLRTHGLEDKRDYKVIEVDFPNMPAMLAEQKVDMAGMVAPFSLTEVKAGHVRSLFTIKDSMGVAQTTLMAARAPVIEKNRAAFIDFFEDVQIGIGWLLDKANRPAALALAARVTKQPESAFADWLFTGDDYYRDPKARPNLVALQANLAVQKELGFLRADIDVSKYADLSLIDAASKRSA